MTNPVDAALLEWLADGPATAVDLAARLAAAAGVELPADTSIGIDERLRQWVDAGWIEPLDA